jgi:hypothetical protein
MLRETMKSHAPEVEANREPDPSTSASDRFAQSDRPRLPIATRRLKGVAKDWEAGSFPYRHWQWRAA